MSPYHPDLRGLGEDFQPFSPASEARYADVLQREVDVLMDRINALLEPAYQWDPDPTGDGLKGVARFL